MIAVLASHTGALLAWAPTVAELPTPPAQSTVRELEAWDAPPPLPYVWSPAHLDWIIPPAPTLSRLAFRWRYTMDEQVAITRAETEWPDADVRARLRVARESLAEADTVRLDDPRTVAGVRYHAELGLITDARADEILTP